MPSFSWTQKVSGQVGITMVDILSDAASPQRIQKSKESLIEATNLSDEMHKYVNSSNRKINVFCFFLIIFSSESILNLHLIRIAFDHVWIRLKEFIKLVNLLESLQKHTTAAHSLNFINSHKYQISITLHTSGFRDLFISSESWKKACVKMGLVTMQRLHFILMN